jgi:hypothetical protein
MTGCDLLVAGEVLYPLPVSSGRSSWKLPIVPDPGLIGAQFFVQGIAIASGSNPLGAITTNAARVNVVGP